jgi:pSer/pThr/pTyr-binding forkhead associated (FHA) protein
MSSLVIPFPESSTPKVLNLRGKRITIGRLADNTIQIYDRTVSAHHAELVQEGDHYRIHDLGATNSIFVNGQPVNDYHLREACTITLGTVECAFQPEAAAEETEETEPLATRAQMHALWATNQDLKERIKTLEEEVQTLQAAGKGEGDASQVSMPREEFEKLAVERAELKNKVLAFEEKNHQLEEDLNVIRRDRENLKRALDEATAKIQSAATAEPAAPAVPVAPIAPVAAVKPAAVIPAVEAAPVAPGPQVKAVPVPRPVPVAKPAATPAVPSAPSAPGVPKAKPVAVPKVVARPAVAAQAVPQAAAAAAPAEISGGPTPLPKPPGTLQKKHPWAQAEEMEPLFRPMAKPAAPAPVAAVAAPQSEEDVTAVTTKLPVPKAVKPAAPLKKTQKIVG